MSALNEPHNTDFNTEKENWKANIKKRKIAVPSEWKINKIMMLRNTGHKYRTFRRGTDIPDRKSVPLRATGRLIFFFNLSVRERRDIFKRHRSLEDIKVQKILGLNVLMSH